MLTVGSKTRERERGERAQYEVRGEGSVIVRADIGYLILYCCVILRFRRIIHAKAACLFIFIVHCAVH